MNTYVVKIVMDKLDQGRQNLSLPEAMSLVAAEMNAKNTAVRTISVYSERGVVVFTSTFDGEAWRA